MKLNLQQFGGRGQKNPRGGGASKPVAAAAEERRTVKRLYSKSQLNDLTADYTPEMFLGRPDFWAGNVASARYLAEDNMPETLDIGGYTFRNMGAPHVNWVDDGRLKNNVVIQMDYQSDEKIGNEYPVVTVGVRIRKFRGKIQTEIIRDHPIYGTRFW